MARVWKSTPGDSEAKSDAVRDAIKKLWLCRLLQPHVFVQIQGHELEANERWLVLSAGPNCLKVVKVKSSPQEEEIYHLTEKSYETGCKSFLVPSMDSVQARFTISFFSEPVVCKAWNASETLTPPYFEGVRTVSCIWSIPFQPR